MNARRLTRALIHKTGPQYQMMSHRTHLRLLQRVCEFRIGVNYRPKTTQPQSVAVRLLSLRFLPWLTRVPPPAVLHRLTNHHGESLRASRA